MKGFQELPVSRKSSILNVWRGSEYAFVLLSGLIDLPQQEMKSNYMWYFVERSRFRFLRKKKVFEVKSAKKGVSLLVKPFPPIYCKIKTCCLSDIKRRIFSPPTSFP